MTITKTLIPAGNPAAPGDFSLMSTAEADDQQVLAEPYVLECYRGSISDHVDWFDWGTSATNFITIKAADGEGHAGVIGAGFVMNGSTTNTAIIKQPYTNILGLEFRNSANFSAIRNVQAGTDCYYDSIICSNSGSDTDTSVAFEVASFRIHLR